MYSDLFEFLYRSQSTCHCLIHCLKMISIWALLLGTYYFMCKGACYYLRLVRVYVTRCFQVEKKFLVTFAKSEAFARPLSIFACFFSKSRILLNLFYLLFLRHLLLGVLGSKKNPCYFCDFCGICRALFGLFSF